MSRSTHLRGHRNQSPPFVPGYGGRNATNSVGVVNVISNVVWPIVLVVGVTVTGCSRNVTTIPSPPVSASCSSNKDMGGVHFSFHKWKEGLAIMFVDHINGGVTENGSLDENTYTDRVSVRRADGTGYEWQLTTKDGRSADLRINDVSYDLTKGALSAIQIDGKKVIVHQVDRDLSKLNIDLAQCTAFVNNSPDIIELVSDEATKQQSKRGITSQ